MCAGCSYEIVYINVIQNNIVFHSRSESGLPHVMAYYENEHILHLWQLLWKTTC